MKTAICTVIKNGHQYLDEWLAYNFQLGFDNIFIYEDYESNSHSDICSKYDGVILSSINDIINSNKSNIMRQVDVFNAWIKKYEKDYDWVAFIDLDEFIMFDEGLELQDFLKDYENYCGVFLFWKIFTANGLINNPKTPLLTTYTEELPLPLPYFLKMPYKSFVNLKMATQMLSHHEIFGGVNVNKIENVTDVIYEKAWINHYFTRSWEEWTDRFNYRGHICFGNRKIDEFFVINPDMLSMKDKLKMGSVKKAITNFTNKIRKKNE